MSNRHALIASCLLLVTACGAGNELSTSPATAPVAPASSVPASAAPATTPPTTPIVVDSTNASDSTSVVEPAETVAPETSTGVVANLPAWQTMSIVDVSGASFALADFIGRPVLVETFATWCPKCRAQLGRTNDAAGSVGADAVVIALSVETDLDAADVAAYAADNGFDNVRFAVLTPEALAAFVEAFGNTVANPPSTPKLVIAADGTAGEFTTGEADADSLVEMLLAAG